MLIFVAVAALSIGGIFTINSVQAHINPDCPNGCIRGGGGCHCFDDYPNLSEASWPEEKKKVPFN